MGVTLLYSARLSLHVNLRTRTHKTHTHALARIHAQEEDFDVISLPLPPSQSVVQSAAAAAAASAGPNVGEMMAGTASFRKQQEASCEGLEEDQVSGVEEGWQLCLRGLSGSAKVHFTFFVCTFGDFYSDDLGDIHNLYLYNTRIHKCTSMYLWFGQTIHIPVTGPEQDLLE